MNLDQSALDRIVDYLERADARARMDRQVLADVIEFLFENPDQGVRELKPLLARLREMP